MKIIYHYDEMTHQYVGFSEIGKSEELPENATEIPLPDGMYRPVFKNGAWVNGISDKEIEQKYQEQDAAIQTETDLQQRIRQAPVDVEGLGQYGTEREIEAIKQGQKVTDLELQSMEQGQKTTDLEIQAMEQGQITTDLVLQSMEQRQEITDINLKLLELEAKVG